MPCAGHGRAGNQGSIRPPPAGCRTPQRRRICSTSGRVVSWPVGLLGWQRNAISTPRVDGRTERIRDRKVLLLPQKEAFHRAADTFQSSGILRKGGCGDQRPAGLSGPDQPEDEVCCPIAAEDLLCRHALMERQLCPQFPAQGVGVAVGRGQCRRDGPGHPFRQAQRADIGRKKSSGSRPNSAR